MHGITPDKFLDYMELFEFSLVLDPRSDLTLHIHLNL